MSAKLGLAGMLAALAVAGLPGVSSAGWCTALTAGLRPPEAPGAAEAPEDGKVSGDGVFKLACRSCRGGGNYYGYGSYYPSYGYYSGYASYYPTYGYYAAYSSYYPAYSYYPSVSYYPAGCGGWSPCGCGPGW